MSGFLSSTKHSLCLHSSRPSLFTFTHAFIRPLQFNDYSGFVLQKAGNKQSKKVGHGESETRAETRTQARQAEIETRQR